MATTVVEQYTWKPTVLNGAVEEDGLKVFAFDSNQTNVVNATTSLGTIASQVLTKSEHVISGSSVVTTPKTPHKIRLLKYGIVIEEVTSSIEEATKPVFYVSPNNFVYPNYSSGNYAGLSHNHSLKTVTMNSLVNMQDLYSYLQKVSVDEPQYLYPEIMFTSDGVNTTLYYELKLDGSFIFDGEERYISGTIDIDNANAGITNLSVLNLNFSVAGTYTLDACAVTNVSNSSGGSVVLNLTNGSSVSNNNGSNITIQNTKTFELTNLQPNSEVRLYRKSDTNELHGVELSGETFAYNYNYTEDEDIVVVVFAIGYEAIRFEATLTNNNTSIPIQQKIDRWYSNPK